MRHDLERGLGADFADVRLHDDPSDRAAADRWGAEALTRGTHIFLGSEARTDDRGLMAHELTHVVQQRPGVRRPASHGSRIATTPAVAPAPAIQGAWYNFSIPFTDYEFDPSISGLKTAGGLVKDTVVDAGHEVASFAEHAWDMGKILWKIARVIKDGAVNALVMLIDAPGRALEYIKDFVLGLVGRAPDKLREVIGEHLTPRWLAAAADGGTRSGSGRRHGDLAGVGGETRWQKLMRHLGARLDYLKANWWEVIKDAALEVLIPGVALYRHFPTMIKELVQGLLSIANGDYNVAVDHLLATAREAMAIVSSFMAQVSIAAFIIGSIIGTPIVGVAALEAIGVIVVATDAAVHVVSIAHAADNLDDPRSPDDHESDYNVIADSSIAVAILLAMVALGAITAAAVKVLLRRFPALAAGIEAARARVRAQFGRGARVPDSPKPHDLRAVEAGIEPLPAPAHHEVRAKLTPEQQVAFDQWVAERTAEGTAAGKAADDIRSGIEAALKGKDPAAVAGMLKRQSRWLKDREARIRQAQALRQGDPLNPTMAHGPVDRGGNVSTRWDSIQGEPSPKEIAEAQRLAKATGEHIELFGDNYAGIDGTIGSPPRPLQLKGYAQAGADPVEMAKEALKNASDAPYSRVEVNIEAPTFTRAQARRAFSKVPAETITDGTAVRRVRVWCSDGVYEPTSFTPVPIPPHLDEPGDRNQPDNAQ